MSVFLPADILLPKTQEPEKWAVIAVDQFVSEPEYWDAARQFIGQAPSALNLVWPEAQLSDDPQKRIGNINAAMAQYLAQGLFETYEDAFILVERTLQNGMQRLGMVGAVDLERYDYTPGSKASIRATEKTVTERIPARVNIRAKAPLELSHVLLLCDDPHGMLIETVYEKRDRLPLLYDFDLMAGGGHIRGWLVTGPVALHFRVCLEIYRTHLPHTVQFAVGDGNHSLAAAKTCYEMDPNPRNRYALVELENIHDPSLSFEPIHRLIVDTDPQALLAALESCCRPGGEPVQWFSGSRSGTVYLDLAQDQLAVGKLQNFLDEYLAGHPGITDYIHGDDSLKRLAAKENAIGFLLPPMDKASLFPGIAADGVLPRKTFSMGHAQEKRYYLEARRIRD